MKRKVIIFTNGDSFLRDIAEKSLIEIGGKNEYIFCREFEFLKSGLDGGFFDVLILINNKPFPKIMHKIIEHLPNTTQNVVKIQEKENGLVTLNLDIILKKKKFFVEDCLIKNGDLDKYKKFFWAMSLYLHSVKKMYLADEAESMSPEFWEKIWLNIFPRVQ